MPSANTTAAIDNLTVALQGVDSGIDAATAALTAAVALIFELALIISLLVISLRAQELEDRIVLSLASGTVTFIIGMLWIDGYPGVSIVLWFLAAYLIAWKGLIVALSSFGPARGLSQFKELLGRIRKH